jgi:hypothetical protein
MVQVPAWHDVCEQVGPIACGENSALAVVATEQSLS